MIYLKNEQVRNLFYKDLLNKEKKGICWLPEWICGVMSEAVQKAKWKVSYYKVASQNDSECPLALDINFLTNIIDESTLPCAILFAHPLGYYDNNVLRLLKYIKSNAPNINCFLDLSQSYGKVDFIDEITLSESTYVSFNGKKLISDGGSLYIKQDNHPKWYDFLHIFSKYVEEQESSFMKMCEDIEKNMNITIYLDENKNFVRSSLYRTYFKTNNSDIKNYLSDHNFGQTFLENPQTNYSFSKEYKAYYENGYLLFHKKRELH